MNFMQSACEYSLNPLCGDVNLPPYSRTPWLTTRRRTCPICKGDVVRSIGNRSSNGSGSELHDQMTDDIRSHITEIHNDSLMSTMPMASIPEDSDSDLEHGDASSTSLVDHSD